MKRLFVLLIALGLVGYGTSASAEASGRVPTVTAASASIPFFACGTWAMLQLSSVKPLRFTKPTIRAALAIPGVKGLSLRAPWTSITSNLAIYDAGVQIAVDDHSRLAIRFIAGVDTPPAFLGNSTLIAAGRIPLPWGQGSTQTSFVPNKVFESAYRATVKQLAAYARTHHIHVLHLPWYAGPSAEIYRGLEVQAAPGYSLDNFLKGYERLVAIGMSFAGSDLSIEFPLSGEGTREVVPPLEAYMSATYGSHNPRLMVQFNDLRDAVPGPQHPAVGVNMERQVGGPGDFDWTIVYQTLVSQKSKSVEIFLQSFDSSLAHAADLRHEIAAFASC